MIRPLHEAVRDLKRKMVTEAITAAQGDTQRAAKLLKVGRGTVYRIMYECSIVVDKSQTRLTFSRNRE